MPLDQANWQINLLAADKTAQAFQGVNRRMQMLDQQTRTTSSVMSAGFAGVTRMLGPLAAAFTAVAIAQKVWHAGMAAGDLGEMAEQIGLNTDQLQAYRLVAAQAGVSAEQLDSAMMRLMKAMGTANDGNDEMIARFEKLGVKLLDTNGNLRKSADIVPELSRGLLKMGSETERNALLMELMGRSGSRMVTMLAEWARGNEAVVSSARQQSAVLSQEVSDAWDKLGDKLKVADQQFSTIAATFAAPISTLALDALNILLGSIRFNIETITKGWAAIVNAGPTGQTTAAIEANIAQLEKQLEVLEKTGRANSEAATNRRQALAEAKAELAARAALSIAPVVTVDTSGKSQPKGDKSKALGNKDAAAAHALMQKQMDELFDSIEKVRKASEGVLDKYGSGAETAARATLELNEMLQMGFIDADTFGRAMQDVTDKADDQARAFRGAAGGFDGFVAGMEQGFSEMDRLNTAFAAGQEMSKLLSDSFTELATTGQLNFEKLLASFANMISQMLIQAAAASAIKALFNAFGGGSGGGGADGLADGIVNLTGSLLGFAEGGNPPVGQPYLVGEHGPEVRIDREPGTIFNRDQIAGMGGGSSTVVVQQTLHFGSDVSRAEMGQWARVVGQQAKDAARSALISERKRGGLKTVFS